jgi:WhiB family redox-sensing transcriptional regulator
MLADAFPVSFPWMNKASCRAPEHEGVDWFPVKGKSNAVQKAICATCPVRRECLEYALDNNEHYGVWAGTTEQGRKALRRRRRAAPLLP